MREATPLVKDAYTLIKKKHFRDAVPVLEKVTASRPADPYPYFLLACAYLHSGELARVELTLKRARSMRQDYLPALQLEAFLLLKSSAEPREVISRYLDILQRYPMDRTVKHALASLRNEKSFQALQRAARFARFVSIPPPGKNETRRTERTGRPSHAARGKPFAIVGILLAVGLMSFFLYMKRDAIRDALPSVGERGERSSAPDLDRMVPDRSWGELVEKGKKSAVTYASPEEMIQDFNAAKQLMKDEKFNGALQKLNRILNGNTTAAVRERAEFLRSFILGLEERSSERIAFADVASRPYIYHGCMVKWRGVVADIRRKEGRMILSLMTDKEAGSRTGVVDVYSSKDGIGVIDGDTVEVSGMFMAAAGGTRLYIDAKSVEKMVMR